MKRENIKTIISVICVYTLVIIFIVLHFSSIKCINCGETYNKKQENKHCYKCGTILHKKNKCENCNVIYDSLDGYKYCTKCGKELNKEEK